MWRLRTASAALTAACLALAGCGSTVQGVEGAGSGGSDSLVAGGAGAADDGLSVGGAAGDGLAAPDGSTPAGGVAGGASAGGAAGGGGSAGGAAGPRAPGGGGGPAAAGGGRSAALPGVTDDTVFIGFAFNDAAATNAFTGSVGGENLTIGDGLAQARAMQKWVNDNGGLAGRKLELVPFRRDTSRPFSVESQRACETFTRDNKVAFGNAGIQFPDENLLTCLEKAGSVALSTSFVPGNQRLYSRFPNTYSPGGFESVAAGRAMVDGLAAAGYFSDPGVKVGVLYYDVPSMVDAFEQGVKPALSARRIELADRFAVSYPDGTSGTGGIASAVQSAALQFRGKGVTHVLFLDAGGALPLFFSQNGQSQGYSPRYGLWSTSFPQVLAGQGAAGQFNRAVALAWLPGGDVPPARAVKNPAADQCLAIMAAAGQNPSSDTARGGMLSICNQFFWYKAVLDSAPSVDREGVRAAAAALGERPSPTGEVDRWRPGKPWGTGQYRVTVFNGGCRCFEYKVGPVVVG